ncbi:MAG: hypothetical protein MHM6MM_000819 [Cercozoa sp. M6MM]
MRKASAAPSLCVLVSSFAGVVSGSSSIDSSLDTHNSLGNNDTPVTGSDSEVVDLCYVKCDGCIVDWGRLFHCAPPGAQPFVLVGMLLALMLMFLWLGKIADVYLSDSMVEIQRITKMSDTTAGCTILALANGAPDLGSGMQAIIYARDAEDAILGMSSLMGGGMFVCNLVLAAIVIASPDFAVKRGPFMRDLGCLWVAVFAIVLCVADLRFRLSEGIALLVFYALYVLVVICAAKIMKKMQRTSLMRPVDVECSQRELTLPSQELSPTAQEQPEETTSQDTRETKLTETTAGGASRRSLVQMAANDAVARGPFTMQFLWHQLKQDMQEHKLDWRQKSTIDKVFDALWTLPVGLLCMISCPITWQVDIDSEPSSWNPLLSLAGVPCSVAFVSSQFLPDFQVGTCPGWLFLGVVTLVVTLTVSLLLRRYARMDWTRPFAKSAFVTLCLLSSVAWINLIAGETVYCLDQLGRMTSLNALFLGVTMLAIGNSVGDLSAAYALSKAGFPCMALSAVYAGPLFNMLVTTGLSITVKTASMPSHMWQVFVSPHGGLLFSGSMILFSLISQAVAIACCGFKARKWLAVLCVANYVAFVAGISLLVFAFGQD